MKVSVVMSVFNGQDYVAAAIDSILAQDMPDFECIVINDGSQDATADILAACTDPRVRVVALPANTNHGIGLSIGLAAAQGDYIAIFDADDVAMPQRLSTQSVFLDANPDVHILGSRGIRVALTLDNEIDRPAHPTDDATIKARLLLMNGSSLLHPTTMIRSTFIRQNNLWYLPRKMSVDTAFWIKCVAKGAKFHTLEQPLIYKRRHGANVTLVNKPAWEPEKVSLRVELLGMYFPELTGSEVHSLAVLMGGGSTVKLSEICAAITAGNKALQEQRSFYGESKAQLRSILQKYLSDWMRTLADPASAQR